MSSAKSRAAKRALDLVVGIPLAVVTLPLVLALALGSALSYRAWPFFVQRRLGLGGREFWFVKLRSLPVSAPRAADKYAIVTVTNTGWGRFLRQWHLDELPQMWLVVTGRMSLVGPRPEMQAVAAQADECFVSERLTARPGCTGLWQISTGSVGLIHESPEYDLFYVRNRTLRVDVWVLLRTVCEVLGGKSLESLDEVPAWTGARPDSDRVETVRPTAGEPAFVGARSGTYPTTRQASEFRPTNGAHVAVEAASTRADQTMPRAAAK